VRRVLIAMGPAVIGVSAAQISALINTQLAASLGDGRISWITYADRLMEFPSALLGVALGTVLLPSLAKLHAEARHERVHVAARLGVAACVPAGAAGGRGAVDPAIPLISTLYQYGRFSLEDVLQTRTALLGYSVGLLGLIVVKILAPGFYARQVMSTPVKIAFSTVLVTQTLALILMQQIGHAGLTLATSIGACFNASLLFLVPEKARYLRPAPGWMPFLSKLMIALFVLAAVLSVDRRPASFWTAAVPVAEGRSPLRCAARLGRAISRRFALLGFSCATSTARRDRRSRAPAVEAIRRPRRRERDSATAARRCGSTCGRGSAASRSRRRDRAHGRKSRSRARALRRVAAFSIAAS
jgi:putative peptidoglycan lipid II flippase